VKKNFVLIVVFFLVPANIAASNVMTAAYAKKHHTDNSEGGISSGKIHDQKGITSYVGRTTTETPPSGGSTTTETPPSGGSTTTETPPSGGSTTTETPPSGGSTTTETQPSPSIAAPQPTQTPTPTQAPTPTSSPTPKPTPSIVCPPGFKLENGMCERDIIRNIIIREFHQLQQPKPNSLIQLDSEQICRELGDQICISSLHHFRQLFIHASKDLLGFWGVTGEVQNTSPNTISQLQVIVHFYDSDGNIVGLTQAFTTPSKLIPMQTATFNIKQSPSEMTGAPKFFRISYDFVG
jgi:hypothetical protein